MINWKFWKKKSGSLSLYDNFPNLIFKKSENKVLHDPISAILATVLFTIGTTAVTVGTVLSVAFAVLSITASVMMAMKARKLSGSMSNELSTLEGGGTLVNTNSIGEVVRVLYGEARIGGNVVFMHSKGDDNNALHFAITWSEGPIEGFETDGDGDMIWMDEKRVSYYTTYKGKDLVNYYIQYGTITGDAYCTLADGGEAAAATSIDVDSTARMRVGEVIWFALDNLAIHSSTISSITDANTVVIANAIPGGRSLNDNEPIYVMQIADPGLTMAKSTHTDAYRGTAYSHFRLVYDMDAWASMPLITAQLKGRRIYDPRTPTIPAAYSNNLALVVVDWMTSERYGMGIPYSLFDDNSVIDAANWCDTEGLTFDGLVVDRQAFTDNLTDILMNGKLMLIWSSGKYKFVCLEDDSSVMTLTEDDIVKDTFEVEIPGIDETPNRIKIAWLDEDDKYRTKSVVMEEGDGEQYPLTDLEARTTDITFTGITDYEKVLKMGAYHLKRARRNKSYRFTARKRAIVLEPGDNINVTHSLPGWTAEKIRVGGMGIAHKGQVQLSCMEEVRPHRPRILFLSLPRTLRE